jgi:hypothetical protein
MEDDFNVFSTLYRYNEKERLCIGNTRVLKSLVRRWSLNRPEDESRVTEIKSYIEKSKRVDGIICIAIMDGEGMVVWDGLHRFKAICMMENPPQALYHVLENPTEDELKERFIMLNKGVPVSSLYIDDTSKHLKTVAEDTVKILYKKYKDHFSTASRPMEPNINRDELYTILYEYLKEHPDTTHHDLLLLLEKANQKIKSANLALKQKVFDKCTKTGCFLFVKDVNLSKIL